MFTFSVNLQKCSVLCASYIRVTYTYLCSFQRCFKENRSKSESQCPVHVCVEEADCQGQLIQSIQYKQFLCLLTLPHSENISVLVIDTDDITKNSQNANTTWIDLSLLKLINFTLSCNINAINTFNVLYCPINV